MSTGFRALGPSLLSVSLFILSCNFSRLTPQNVFAQDLSAGEMVNTVAGTTCACANFTRKCYDLSNSAQRDQFASVCGAGAAACTQQSTCTIHAPLDLCQSVSWLDHWKPGTKVETSGSLSRGFCTYIHELVHLCYNHNDTVCKMEGVALDWQKSCLKTWAKSECAAGGNQCDAACYQTYYYTYFSRQQKCSCESSAGADARQSCCNCYEECLNGDYDRDDYIQNLPSECLSYLTDAAKQDSRKYTCNMLVGDNVHSCMIFKGTPGQKLSCEEPKAVPTMPPLPIPSASIPAGQIPPAPHSSSTPDPTPSPTQNPAAYPVTPSASVEDISEMSELAPDVIPNMNLAPQIAPTTPPNPTPAEGVVFIN